MSGSYEAAFSFDKDIVLRFAVISADRPPDGNTDAGSLADIKVENSHGHYGFILNTNGSTGLRTWERCEKIIEWVRVMAVIGKNFSIMESGGFKLAGIIPWFVWAFLHVMFLPQLQNQRR
jgi:hypothetical protein